MEEDTALQDHDVDHLRPLSLVYLLSTVLDVAGFCLGGVPLQDTNAEVLCKERDEDTSHGDGTGSALITKFSQTLAGKHNLSMRKEVNEGSRNDDASAELSQYSDDDVVW